MPENKNKNNDKAESLPKATNFQKIFILILIAVIFILTATFFYTIGKRTVEENNVSTKIDAQESVPSQVANESSEQVSADEESLAVDSTVPDSASSVSTPYPDLYVVKYDFSEDPKKGEEFTVSIKIGNKGTAKAKSFHWSWYSTSQNKICEGKIDNLAVGETETVECKHTYNSWSTYATRAVVDSSAEIYESNESNNTASKSIVPIHDAPKPDLIISEYNFNHAPKKGEEFTISIDVYNQGDTAVGSFWWEWWPTPHGEACREKIDGLSAHGGKIVSCTYTYNAWANYATKAVADADNDISESDESNNVYTENVIPIH
jgi:subtilase family serine protease